MALPPFTKLSRLQIADPDYDPTNTSLSHLPALILPKVTDTQGIALTTALKAISEQEVQGLMYYDTKNNQVVIYAGNKAQAITLGDIKVAAVSDRIRRTVSDDQPDPVGIFNLSYLQFINQEGSVLVDDLMPCAFLTKAYGTGPGQAQTCTVFTGDYLKDPYSSPSALVELQSTTGVLLISRLTQVQINALKKPIINGMIVYNTDTDEFNFYQGGAWVPLPFDDGTMVLPSLTQAEINAIPTGELEAGMMVYNTNLDQPCIYQLNNSAWNQMVTTNQGTLPLPSLTTVQRTAIKNLVNGMMVYDSTLNQLYTYQNTGNSFAQWGQMVTTINGTFPLPRLTTVQRQAVSSPNPGWMVFDSTLNQPYIYQNGAWQPYITANNLPLPALANGIQSYYTPGPYTWTPPAGISCCRVTIVGGGGGGGGSAGGSSTPDYYAAPGGGGGATVIKFLTSLSPSTPLSIIVGSGGAGGSGGAVGGTGGTTSVTCNSIKYSAVGGYGGSGTSSPGIYMGGSGGIASGGDINQNGQPGQSGGQFGNTGVNGSSGMGGSSSQGGGATGQINNTRQNPSPGTVGTAGGGGSGGYSGTNGSSAAGGAGGNGVVIIEY